MYANVILHNANPNGANIGDCLTRATCVALNVPYKDIERYLTKRAGYFYFDYHKCWKNCFAIFEELGATFVKKTGRTLGKLAQEVEALSKAGKVIILLSTHHAVAMKDGAAVDTYDSSNKRTRGYWIFEGMSIDTAREKLSPKTVELEKIEKQRKEEETMKTTATTNQPTTVETTAAIVPEVLPPEQPTATAIPAPLQEQQSNLPGALLDLDERTLQLLKRQANIAAALPGVKSLQLVGRWLWLEFAGKPTAEIRQQLKDNRWAWAPKKGKWTYHNPEEPRPGKHRYMSFEEIESNHGSVAII